MGSELEVAILKKWAVLSEKAKAILELVYNPYSNKGRTFKMTIGEDTDIFAGKMKILTEEIYQDIISYEGIGETVSVERNGQEVIFMGLYDEY